MLDGKADLPRPEVQPLPHGLAGLASSATTKSEKTEGAGPRRSGAKLDARLLNDYLRKKAEIRRQEARQGVHRQRRGDRAALIAWLQKQEKKQHLTADARWIYRWTSPLASSAVAGRDDRADRPGGRSAPRSPRPAAARSWLSSPSWCCRPGGGGAVRPRGAVEDDRVLPLLPRDGALRPEPPGGRRLAAGQHYQNNRIPRDKACFTCHTDYTLFGDAKAKLRGLRHVYVNYLGRSPRRSNSTSRTTTASACTATPARGASRRAQGEVPRSAAPPPRAWSATPRSTPVDKVAPAGEMGRERALP